MKKIIVFLPFIFFTFVTYSQVTFTEGGIWQVKLNGKTATGTDLGIKAAPYNKQFIYYIFDEEDKTAYFVIAANKNSLTRDKLQSLVEKQVAGEGSYKIYEHQEDVPEEFVERMNGRGGLTGKKVLLVADIQNSTLPLIFDPEKRKMIGINNEIKFELIYSGSW